MNKPAEQLKKIIEYTLPWLVLAILLFYSYVDFFKHEYGFAWLSNGSIDHVFVEQPAPTLIVGDRLVQVGPLTWDAFHSDLRKMFFEGVKPGEVTPVMVERNGQTLTIQWKLPGLNSGEVWDQLRSQWFLAYAFWFAGLLAALLLRPKNEGWWLMLAFNFLTAIWLVTGSGPSNYHLWYSSLILRAAIWLGLPVYLHFHWIFPKPLGKLPGILVGTGYMLALVLMVAQWLQVLPDSLYLLGFLIAVLGSLTLLIVHAFRQPESRRDLRAIFISALLALAPLISIAVVESLHDGSSRVVVLILLSFPLLPFGYLYSAYRRQAGGLEIRVNRLVTTYAFLIVMATVGIPCIALIDRLPPLPDETLMVGASSALIATGLSLWGYPHFQNFMEGHLLGIPVKTEQIQELYSRGTSASTSINALVDLLKNVMLPSLLVRQFLFVQFNHDSVVVLLAIGLDEKQFLSDDSLSRLLAFRDGVAEHDDEVKPFSWVRLMLPLKVGKDVLGLWLFGRRDPDDFYSQHEYPLFQSLADQTSIALSNIIQTERLRAAYQANIRRSEESRQNMALELHDGILNKMAALIMKLDDQTITPEFQKSYTELTGEVRKMIKELRPATLNYGLPIAIEGCADHLMERSDGRLKFFIDLKSEGARYSAEVEQHIFRIVQEACANAQRHANSTQITISGRLESQTIEINVQDNGSGFDAIERLDLDALQANNHFGVTGMFERAELIGAVVKIESQPKQGTRVQIKWDSNRDQSVPAAN